MTALLIGCRSAADPLRIRCGSGVDCAVVTSPTSVPPSSPAAGFRPWQDAWQDALYGPSGFYRQPAGPAGHFLTATHGLLGEQLARGLLAYLHDEAGMPVRTIVDVGAGRGELAEALVRAAVDRGVDVRVVAVDVVQRPTGLDPRVDWVVSPGGAGLPDALTGLREVAVLAHEWLDVVPCPVAQLDEDGVLQLVHVRADGAESLGGPLDPADEEWAGVHWRVDEPGDRVEIGRARDAAWRDLVGRVEAGLVIAVDYGHTAADRPPLGTLTSFRDGVQVEAVPDGTSDVTAHVAMDSLGADELHQQRDLLRRCGVSGRLPDTALARTDPPAYLAELSAANARAQLVNPASFGAFWWAITRVDGSENGRSG